VRQWSRALLPAPAANRPEWRGLYVPRAPLRCVATLYPCGHQRLERLRGRRSIAWREWGAVSGRSRGARTSARGRPIDHGRSVVRAGRARHPVLDGGGWQRRRGSRGRHHAAGRSGDRSARPFVRSVSRDRDRARSRHAGNSIGRTRWNDDPVLHSEWHRHFRYCVRRRTRSYAVGRPRAWRDGPSQGVAI